MHRPRPKRLTGFSYIGVHRYFITCCTARRQKVFENGALAHAAEVTLCDSARTERFAVLAFCFMPDHLHLLVEGTDVGADLRRFVSQTKQRIGYQLRGSARGRLWQDGYHERVLRTDEDTVAIARYILENPIRAGLSAAIGEYRHAGSGCCSIRDLIPVWDAQR